MKKYSVSVNKGRLHLRPEELAFGQEQIAGFNCLLYIGDEQYDPQELHAEILPVLADFCKKKGFKALFECPEGFKILLPDHAALKEYPAHSKIHELQDDLFYYSK